jgi:hypothetical protein
VIVTGDRIAWVGDAKAAPTVADLVIDGSGRYLIPGLWDMHVHLTFEPALTDSMAALFLAHGITSVRDTGGPIDRLAEIGARYAGALAPRLFFSGPLLDGRTVVYDGGDPGRPPIGTRIASPEEAREKVAALAARGARFIKIYEMVDRAVFDALVVAAAEHGLPVAAHVPLALTAREAGPDLDSLEHLRNIDIACARNADALLDARRAMIDEYEGSRGYPLRSKIHKTQRLSAIADYDEATCDAVIAALAKTIQVPTLRLNAFRISRPYQRADFDAALAKFPAGPLRREWEEDAAARRERDPGDLRFAEWSLRLVGMMHDRGVAIGAGTDTPISLAIPGYSLHTELELLVRAGLSPAEALESATLVPARFLSLDDELGRIAVGQRADLVLLDANPLEDIRNTRRIAGVVTRGRWLGHDALEGMLRGEPHSAATTAD